jgi:hypothetical protein
MMNFIPRNYEDHAGLFYSIVYYLPRSQNEALF